MYLLAFAEDFSDCCDYEDMVTGCRLQPNVGATSGGLECLCGIGCEREFQFESRAKCEAALKCEFMTSCASVSSSSRRTYYIYTHPQNVGLRACSKEALFWSLEDPWSNFISFLYYLPLNSERFRNTGFDSWKICYQNLRDGFTKRGNDVMFMLSTWIIRAHCQREKFAIYINLTALEGRNKQTVYIWICKKTVAFWEGPIKLHPDFLKLKVRGFEKAAIAKFFFLKANTNFGVSIWGQMLPQIYIPNPIFPADWLLGSQGKTTCSNNRTRRVSHVHSTTSKLASYRDTEAVEIVLCRSRRRNFFPLDYSFRRSMGNQSPLASLKQVFFSQFISRPDVLRTSAHCLFQSFIYTMTDPTSWVALGLGLGSWMKRANLTFETGLEEGLFRSLLREVSQSLLFLWVHHGGFLWEHVVNPRHVVVFPFLSNFDFSVTLRLKSESEIGGKYEICAQPTTVMRAIRLGFRDLNISGGLLCQFWCRKGIGVCIMIVMHFKRRSLEFFSV